MKWILQLIDNCNLFWFARETRDKARISSYLNRQTSERDVKIFHGVIELKSAFARVMRKYRREKRRV